MSPLRRQIEANLIAESVFSQHGPYRLVVRPSRRGRDNLGSTPGGDIWRVLGFSKNGLVILASCQLALIEAGAYKMENGHTGD